MTDNDMLIVDARLSHSNYIKREIAYQAELGIDDPLVIVDIDEVVERYRKWYHLLPRAEIKQVLDLGVDPSRIIYANPCKQNAHLPFAKKHNVDLMTFDSEEELIKIKMLYRSASFHVGSDCLSSDAFAFAIKEARRIFDMGQQVGFDMNVLDIGGGYRGRDVDHPTIEENADIINQCLDEYFPAAEGVKIIAEPGRYLVETAVSAAANIIGRRQKTY
ncbi:ornithine decarboxylase-like [Mizuhopecten yessoensis]|uniref:ornithine decarboxylase-like n=1 Tax=Mizuhopecten yessoensis TaxID=6573 RepID=UPI000B45D98B|nr:ornithine decarboxylase-like [Mizuhopecten yessoensis]